jgi:hypothetical protein
MFQTDSPQLAPSPQSQDDALPLRIKDITAPDFTPVPMTRARHDGWTPQRQVAFLRALSLTGTVESAARMVAMSRKSAYQLRARAGAESFADAWDIALSSGRARMFDAMMETALNGVTTIKLKLGGSIEIERGPDRRLRTSQLKAPQPGEYRFGHGSPKGDKR